MIVEEIVIVLMSLGAAAIVSGLLYLLNKAPDDTEYWEDDGK